MTITPSPPVVMAPINGVPYPRWHAAWCDVGNHELDWRAMAEEPDDKRDAPGCSGYVTTLFLPEVRRSDSDGFPVTRPLQPRWVVSLEQDPCVGLTEHGPIVGEAVVALSCETTGEVVLRLMPGEARELSAALVRAADMKLFDR